MTNKKALAFDDATLARLERLALVADRVRVGRMKGERRSRRRGTSTEFADYRNYTAGDDLRRLDWNIYARLEQPFIKLLEDEEDLAVHLVLDSSGSMDWPQSQPGNKFLFGRHLVAALAYVALAGGDLVNVAMLEEDVQRVWGPYRGQGQIHRLLSFLESARSEGQTNLNHSLRQYSRRASRPGLLLLLSDLLSPAGYRRGLGDCLAKGYEIGVLHILSPEERRPIVEGELELEDVETGAVVEVTVDASTVQDYEAALSSWQNEIAAYCSARAIHYVPVSSAMDWENLILSLLRRRGIVR